MALLRVSLEWTPMPLIIYLSVHRLDNGTVLAEYVAAPGGVGESLAWLLLRCVKVRRLPPRRKRTALAQPVPRAHTGLGIRLRL